MFEYNVKLVILISFPNYIFYIIIIVVLIKININ